MAARGMRGGGGFFPGPFGTGGGGPFRDFPGRMFEGGHRRMGQGEVRAAILVLLEERPMHGYQIIREITERSGGMWRPSPGSVYPALQQLEDEGLVRIEQEEGRKVVHLTEEGRRYVAGHREELGAPWEAASKNFSEEFLEMRGLVEQVAVAAMQVVQAGSGEQVAEARRLLTETRRQLYRVLAGE
ncbi:PadR family transcriptional regulator [Rubrobacter calidifluminis]|uniref:PadR family transcriptional regulator n=1 Tax=Rubrobacter calidifluminis TaxID=1392640 RepID=UPI00235F10A9|nr:PadR family transcriptional regulator [Rubrobacter calidifluminis]